MMKILLLAALCITYCNAESHPNTRDDWSYNLHTHVKTVSKQLSDVKSSDGTLDEELSLLKSQLQDPKEFLESGLIQSNYNVSDSCAQQTLFLLNNTALLTPVFDSWGKLEAGVFQGNLKWLGNFDECLNITVDARGQLPGDKFETRYCSAGFPINKLMTIQMGMCVPKGCDSEDVTAFINAVWPLHNAGALCKPMFDERPWYGGNTAALFFVLLMIGICCLATLYEVVLILIEKFASPKHDGVDETTPLLGAHIQSADSLSQPKQSLFARVVLSFSFYSNGCKVLDTRQPRGNINCLNGIRFFSMSWVITGHCFLFLTMSQIKNSLWIMTVLRRWTFQPILNATVSVDSFFVLSGLLVAYLFLKDFHRRKIRAGGFFKALPMIYFQRYFRLTPAYGFMILIWASLLYYAWDGPNWPYNAETPTCVDPNCVKYWHLSILYVNNIFKADKMCAAWGWYLSNDFQFFLIAPFIVFLFYLNELAGLVVGAVAVIGSLIAATVASDEQRYAQAFAIPGAIRNFTIPKGPNHYPEYFVPWSRYQTYGIGLIAGLLLFKFKTNNYKIPTVVNLFLWGLSAGMCLSYLYGPLSAETGGHTIMLGEVDAYNGLGRTAWALGLSYIIISCALGQGGWANEFLSWKGFIPLSRLTYCAYLIHIPVIDFVISASRNGSFYTDVTLVWDILSAVTAALGVAFAFSLVFEVPFVNLDKIFLSPLSIKKYRKQEETIESSAPGRDRSTTPPPKYENIERNGAAANA